MRRTEKDLLRCRSAAVRTNPRRTWLIVVTMSAGEAGVGEARAGDGRRRRFVERPVSRSKGASLPCLQDVYGMTRYLSSEAGLIETPVPAICDTGIIPPVISGRTAKKSSGSQS